VSRKEAAIAVDQEAEISAGEDRDGGQEDHQALQERDGMDGFRGRLERGDDAKPEYGILAEPDRHGDQKSRKSHSARAKESGYAEAAEKQKAEAPALIHESQQRADAETEEGSPD